MTETASAAALRQAAGKLARDLGPGRTVLSRPGLSGERLAAFVEGLALGGYRYTLATGPPPPKRTVELADVTDADAVEAGLRAAAATAWARDLANTPSSVKTPAWLGQQAAAELAPLGVEVAVHERRLAAPSTASAACSRSAAVRRRRRA